jgi:hypothetical protein
VSGVRVWVGVEVGGCLHLGACVCLGTSWGPGGVGLPTVLCLHVYASEARVVLQEGLGMATQE